MRRILRARRTRKSHFFSPEIRLLRPSRQPPTPQRTGRNRYLLREDKVPPIWCISFAYQVLNPSGFRRKGNDQPKA